jgi:hypothetical protein
MQHKILHFGEYIFMTKFWELLEESVIVQGLMTVGVWAAIIYMAICGKPVPEILTAGGMGILGFWFGSKSQMAAASAAKAVVAAAAKNK